MTLDRFYPIFDNPSWLQRVVPLGIKLVQLRCKTLSGAQLRNAISQSKSICDSYDCVLVVNDYWQIAIDTGCSFVHLGQEDLDTADVSCAVT